MSLSPQKSEASKKKIKEKPAKKSSTSQSRDSFSTDSKNFNPAIFKSNQEFYLKMIQKNGLDKSLTHIHNRLGELEPQIYEGGFNQAKFEELQTLRKLCRELWTLRLDKNLKR